MDGASSLPFPPLATFPEAALADALSRVWKLGRGLPPHHHYLGTVSFFLRELTQR